MSNDPLVIAREKLADLLRGFGLDPVDLNDIASVYIDPGVVTVTRFRRGEDGRVFAVGTGNDVAPATETTTIRFETTTIRRES